MKSFFGFTGFFFLTIYLAFFELGVFNVNVNVTLIAPSNNLKVIKVERYAAHTFNSIIYASFYTQLMFIRVYQKEYKKQKSVNILLFKKINCIHA